MEREQEQDYLVLSPLPADEQERLCWAVYHANQAAQKLASGVDTTDEQQLRALIEAGQPARERLIVGNMALVVAVAQRYCVPGLDAEDLYQEGVIGLMHAIERFDPRKGHRFSTYAIHWIRQSIQRAIVHGDTIRQPLHQRVAMSQIARAADQLSQELGRHPTRQDIVRALGWSLRRVDEVLRGNIFLCSLDRPISAHAGSYRRTLTLAEVVTDPTMEGVDDTAIRRAEYCRFRDALSDALSALSARERYVLAARYELGGHELQNLEEIGQKVGLTRGRVRQIETEARAKLRAQLTGDAQGRRR